MAFILSHLVSPTVQPRQRLPEEEPLPKRSPVDVLRRGQLRFDLGSEEIRIRQLGHHITTFIQCDQIETTLNFVGALVIWSL